MRRMNKNKNYRIKQVAYGCGNDVRYYAQERILGLFWLNVCCFGEYFSDFDSCENFLKSHINSKKKHTVDYFYYD